MSSPATLTRDDVPGSSASDPDVTLVRAVAEGDDQAFEALVRRHERRLFNFLRAATRSDSEAEELTQDTFVRAYRSLGGFRGQSSFKTWLYTIATNLVRTHLKRRARWGWLKGPARRTDMHENEPDREPVSPEETAEASLVRRDAIDRALSTLDPDLRLVVTLRDVEGLDYREIAASLGVPLGTVESRLFRARQRLRPLLAPLLER